MTTDTTAPPANQKALRKEKRSLRFETMQDILDDVEMLASGPVTSLGNWTPAQNIDHLRRVIRISHSGTDFKMPLPIRLLGKLLKRRFLKSPFKPGFKTVALFDPPDENTMQQAVVALREEIEAATRPGAMCHPSPLFGPMSHEQWEQLHCRHAELHLGFLLPATSD